MSKLQVDDIVNKDDTGSVGFSRGVVVTGVMTATSFSGTVSSSTGSFSGDVDIADKIVHTGDTNTAIRFPAADTFTVETAGSERVRVTSAGLVGIGTDNPGDELDIQNNGASFINIKNNTDSGRLVLGSNTSANQIKSADSGNGARALQIFTGTTTTNGINIDTSGRVGLGTDSPGDFNASGDNFVVSGTGNVGMTLASLDSGSNTIYFADATTGTGEYIGFIEYIHSSNAMRFTTSASEAMRVDSSGRLLIGATSARSAGDVTAPLQIEGTGYQTSSLNLISNAGASAGNVAHITLAKSRGTSDGSSTAVASGDNLGSIQWAGADGTDLNSTAALISAAVDTTPGSNDMPGRLEFSTTADGASSPTLRMSIDSSGQVFMGSSSSTFNVIANKYNQAALHLSGGGGGSANIDLHGSNHSSDAKVITFDTNSAERMRILSDGRLLVGTASALSDGLICFKGTFSSNRGLVLESSESSGEMIRFNTSSGNAGKIDSNGTSTTYGTSSDYRLKENIVDLDGAIDRVKQLAPKRFNFIADAETTVDGFLAHEAQTVVPEAITGTHNGVEVWKEGAELPDGVSVGDNKLDEDGNTIPDYQCIDQSKLVPLLTAALKEAIAEIETLKTKVAALEG